MDIHNPPMDFFVKRFSFTKQPNVHRGLLDLRPKSMDYSKILANTARMIPQDSKDPVILFTTLEELAVKRLYEFLADKNQLVVVSPVIQSLFHILKNKTGSLGFIGIGDSNVETPKKLLSFVTSIHNNDSFLEAKAAERLLLDLKQHLKNRDLSDDLLGLIVEEKPGKFGILNLEELTIKSRMKRLATISQPPTHEALRAPFSTEAGFAIYSATIEGLETINSRADSNDISSDKSPDHPTHQRKKLTLGMASIQIPSHFSEAYRGPLVDAIKQWLHHLGLAPHSIEHIHISVPWLALSAYLAQLLALEFGSQPTIHHLDQGFGWHPMATLFQSWLLADRGPNLYIYPCQNQTFLSVAWI